MAREVIHFWNILPGCAFLSIEGSSSPEAASPERQLVRQEIAVSTTSGAGLRSYRLLNDYLLEGIIPESWSKEGSLVSLTEELLKDDGWQTATAWDIVKALWTLGCESARREVSTRGCQMDFTYRVLDILPSGSTIQVIQ